MLLVKTRGFFFFFRTSAWSVIYANGIRMWLMAGRNAQIICMEQTLIAKLSVWCHSWWLLCWKFLLFVLCSGGFAVITFQGISAKRRIQHLLRGSACNSFPLVNRKDLINLSNCGSLEPRLFFLFRVFTFLQHIKPSFSHLSLSPSVALTRLALKSLEADSQCSAGVCAPEVAKAHTSFTREEGQIRVLTE